MKRRTTLVFITLLLASGLAGLVWQRHTNAKMRRELAHRRGLTTEQDRLEEEHRRLEAARILPEEVGERQEDRETLAALASEIEFARRRLKAPPAEAAARGAAPAAHPSLREATLDVSEWRNAGDRATTDAVETVLWAAAHGDVETLAGLIHFSDDTRIQATEILASLPPALRGEVATPEQLVAVLTANAVPLGRAAVTAEFNQPGTTKLVVQLTDVDGKTRETVISLRATDGHWRLLVPDGALAGYMNALQQPAAP